MENDIQLTTTKGECAGTDANAGHDGGGTVREISGTPRRGQFTRFAAYQESIRFLEEAAAALDQAHACLKDAKVDDIVTLWQTSRRLSIRDLRSILDGMLMCAREVQCEDCDKPLAECQCAWLREPIRRGA